MFNKALALIPTFLLQSCIEQYLSYQPSNLPLPPPIIDKGVIDVPVTKIFCEKTSTGPFDYRTTDACTGEPLVFIKRIRRSDGEVTWNGIDLSLKRVAEDVEGARVEDNQCLLQIRNDVTHERGLFRYQMQPSGTLSLNCP